MSNNYAGMRRALAGEPGAAARCAARLLAIRERLAPLRARKRDGTLLLATWNLRDFDSNKFGFGPRRPESLYYIAEMIACFDLVAVQEVARDLSALRRVMGILGPEWDFIATDTTEGPGGNGERMAFVFNTEKVSFRKVAGEIVLPEGQLVVAPGRAQPAGEAPSAPAAPAKGQQFARSPFLVAFQSGWFRFSLCTVHIYYGRESGPELERRIAEIERLVAFLADRQDRASRQERDETGNVENYILLGDFNVVSPEHRTMAALKGRGFLVPEQIDGRILGAERKQFYDQIAVRVLDKRFRVTAGGILDPFADVFRDNDEDRAIWGGFVPASDPEEGGANAAARYRKWRTWQMSDHEPLWLEIVTDFAEDYLSRIAAR